MTGKPGFAPPLMGHQWLCNGGLGSRMPGALILVLAATIFQAGAYLPAAEQQGPNAARSTQPEPAVDASVARCRVFALRHISAAKGREYLSQLNIGTVSKLPGANMLLVTASPRDLIKATSVLELVDAQDQFVIRTLLPAASAVDCPSPEHIMAELKQILVGTLLAAPISQVQTKAIIDLHNDSIIAIAPAGKVEEIISAFEKTRGPSITAAKPAAGPNEPSPPPGELAVTPTSTAKAPYGNELPTEPNAGKVSKKEVPKGEKTGAPEFAAIPESDTNEAEPNELFGRLLNTLADAEKKAAGQTPAVAPSEPAVSELPAPTEPNLAAVSVEPNQPETVAFVPEANTAAISHEPRPQPGEPVSKTGEDRLAAILRRLEALEGTASLTPEPNAEPYRERRAPEVGQPNEVEHPVPKIAFYEPELIPHANDVLKVALPEQLLLTDFLSFVGEYLQLDYIFDPAEVKGNVTLRLHGKLRGDLRVKDLYPLLRNVLQFNDFVMTRSGNLVTIRHVTNQKRTDPQIVRTSEDIIQAGDVIITRVFQLKHVEAAVGQSLLANMQLSFEITPIPETRTLIVTGYAHRMGRIEELLDIIDKPGEPKQFKARKLRYTMAETLAPKIKTLVEQLGTISVTVAATPTATPAAIATMPLSPAALRERLRISRTVPPTQPGQPTPSAQAQEAVYLEPDQRTNRILMIGQAGQIATVDELIDTLDVEKQDLRSLRLYEIRNVDAEEVRKKLEELGIVSTGAATTTTRITQRPPIRTRPGRPEVPAAPGAPAPAGAAAGTTETGEYVAEEAQVVILGTINALLVNATAEQHAQIAMIIGYVDSVLEQKDIPYVVYPLENQDPTKLAETLNKFILETTTKQEKDAKITETIKRTEEDIIIIPDENTFSLVVYASKKNQQWLSNLIRQLDKRRPQVLIDVTLVQITKDDKFSMDLNFLAGIPDMTYVSGQTGVTTTISDLLSAPASDRKSFQEFQSLDGNFKGFYGDKKINALLTAVETKKYGRIMARPKLLVNDNETGSIKTTDTTYVKRTSTNIIGTETPQTATQTVFDNYSAGITLSITPHISEGDNLRLEIQLNRSGFTSVPTGDIPPDKADADVTTIVTVPDRSTIILGGMEKVDSSKGGEKVPILGDIPLIGGLFRSVSKADRQDKLYIFVKAHILRPAGETAMADLKEVSRQNRDRFESLEAEMGKYHDWPGIKPKPMDPAKILEAN